MKPLDGRTIAVSIGNAPDLRRLGIPTQEVDRALLAICGALIRAGAIIVNSGDLRPEGATFTIFRHLAGVYAGQDAQPFHLFLPEHSARALDFLGLRSAVVAASSVSRISVVSGHSLAHVRNDEEGLVVSFDGQRTVVRNDAELVHALFRDRALPPSESLTKARQAVTSVCDARVLMGGKMGISDHPDDRFDGALPGVVEEALMTLQANKLVFPLSAFGGASRDVSIALGLLEEADRVPRGNQDPRYERGISALEEFRNGAVTAKLAGATSFLGSDNVDLLAHRIVSYLAMPH